MAKKQTDPSLDADVNDVIGDLFKEETTAVETVSEVEVASEVETASEKVGKPDTIPSEVKHGSSPSPDFPTDKVPQTHGNDIKMEITTLTDNGENAGDSEMTELQAFAQYGAGFAQFNQNAEQDAVQNEEMFMQEEALPKVKKLVITETSSMINPSLGDLLDVMDSKYTLVIAASKRARQLSDGSDTLVICDSKKPVSIACHEIKSGKVSFTRRKDGLK